jgi:hypothetical protein
MKTIILLLLAFTGYSQNTTIHFYYSSEQLTGAEIMFPVRGTDFYLGGGLSGAWNIKEVVTGHINEYDKSQTITNKDREEWCSLYTVCSTGFLRQFLIKYRVGLAVYNEKVTFNDKYTKIKKVNYLPLIGVSAMYSITDDFGIEAGFDIFNKATLGFTVKF